MTGDGGQHLAAKFALAHPEWRGGNVEHEVAAGLNQRLDRIDRVEALVPEVLVVPGVLADGERHLLAAERKQRLASGRGEVAHLVEHVVGGQKHFRLQEGDGAVLEQGGGIHDRLAGFGMGRGHQSANHGDAAGLGGNAFHRLAIAGDKRRTLDQVPGRIAADGQLGEQDQAGAGRPRLLREVDDLGGVAGEIPNCGIDLSQRDLHTSSVKGRCAGAKSAESSMVGRESPLVLACRRIRGAVSTSGTLAPTFSVGLVGWSILAERVGRRTGQRELARRPVRRYRLPRRGGAARAHSADGLQARTSSWPRWA